MLRAGKFVNRLITATPIVLIGFLIFGIKVCDRYLETGPLQAAHTGQKPTFYRPLFPVRKAPGDALLFYRRHSGRI